MRNLRVYILFAALVLLVFACKKETNTTPVVTTGDGISVPEGFPPIPYPADNQYSLKRWELGKRLFYDPILSSDSSLSCASCHKADIAFSDDVAFSMGVKGRAGTRNSPTLTNVAYLPYFTREGGVPTLEMQVLVPIQEHNEFDFNIVLIADRLQQSKEYVAMSWEAYNRPPDHFVITRALAMFERSLISGNSAYDRYYFQKNTGALTADEIKGMELFFSAKTNCSSCHGGFNFSNYAFSNNGLYETYADIGRKRLTNNDTDLALFKVPTLRNIALTAPYMHDGSVKTLEEVVEHYNTGGKNHPHKSKLIMPLQLTPTEKAQLVAFLKSLTDYDFVNNKKFKP